MNDKEEGASEKGVKSNGENVGIIKTILNKSYEKTPLTAHSFAFATIGENEFKVKIFGENLESFQLPIEKKKRTNRKRIGFGCALKKSKK